MNYKATLVNTTGSFTLGTDSGNFIFKHGNLSNIVPASVKEYLAEQIDINNRPLFVFEEVEDVDDVENIPKDIEDKEEQIPDKPAGKKITKKAVE